MIFFQFLHLFTNFSQIFHIFLYVFQFRHFWRNDENSISRIILADENFSRQILLLDKNTKSEITEKDFRRVTTFLGRNKNVD